MSKQVDEIILKTQKSYEQWRLEPLDRKVALLHKLADFYADNAHEVAVAIAEDMGKPVKQGRGEAKTCENIFRYYADNAEQLLKADLLPNTEINAGRVELHPTGIILAIMPWNFPHYQLARVLAPNILLGNAVLFKHAAICKRSAAQVESIVNNAGAPVNLVVNSNFTHSEVYEAIAHDLITGVTFTGGEIGGQAIAEAAGKNLKKAVLELGGNDPFIVFDVKEFQKAAKLAAQQRLSNAGQACTSPKRVIVERKIFDDFVAAYSEEFLAVKPGDPLSEETALGPLSSESAASELREWMREAQKVDFTILGDIDELDREGQAFSPLVILNPDREHPIWKTELFGPITMITAVDSVAEAIEIANDSPYGLGATVFTDSDEAAELFTRELETGMIGLNTPRGANPSYPFGGVKRSGIGRELGPYGLREFANLKLIVDTPAKNNAN